MADEQHATDMSANESAESRILPRYNLLIRPAKLVTTTAEYLCILRDVSPGGFKARTFHKIRQQGQMILELGNGDRYDVERVWERDDHSGFRFVTAVPVEYLLNEEGLFRKRPVRLKMNLPGLVVAGREQAPVIVRDLSQQGARLECEAEWALDRQVRLEIAGLPAIISKVRWRRPGAIGLIFEQTFKLDELARAAATLQHTVADADRDEEAGGLARYA